MRVTLLIVACILIGPVTAGRLPFQCSIRSVRVSGLPTQIRLLEAAELASHTADYMRGQSIDPFGLICWPGAQSLSSELVRLSKKRSGNLEGMCVLEIGCGSGLCSLTAAMLGAKVIATDPNEQALQLLAASADSHKVSVDTRPWSLHQPFDQLATECAGRETIVIASDILYSEELAELLAARVAEACSFGAKAIVADSIGLYSPLFCTTLLKIRTLSHVSTSRDVVQQFSAPGVSTKASTRVWDADVEIICVS
mmetsp:Transcript_40358/g.84649  ORF Transcript_40358/g.84649 Transcript_40358/m.84649 type:complete len:254 (-) Transcript_40358:669-1430(-)|eukprot:6189197-Pleurochrysis_carterae.AAC.3